MTAFELNADDSVLPQIKGHGVSHSPWDYHSTTVGGKRKKMTKCRKQGMKSCKNRRRVKYTRRKRNNRTHKQKLSYK